MKKILAMMLTAAMMLSMGTAAMAVKDYDGSQDNQPANFTKKYVVENGTAPAETFDFTIDPYKAIDGDKVVIYEEDAEGKVLTDKVIIADNAETLDEVETKTVSDYMEAVCEKLNASEEDLKAVYSEAVATGTKDATVKVTLNAADFPELGIYTFKVVEEKGKTAGVTYSETPLYLVVTILRTDANTGATDTAEGHVKYVAAVHYETEAGTKDSAITNKYEAGQLTVTKKIEGNMADKTKKFDFTITFTPASGEKFDTTVQIMQDDVSTGTEYKAEPGDNGTYVVTVKLGDGESVKINNIPEGTTYDISEVTAGYTQTTEDSKVEGTEKADNKIEANDNDAIVYVNTLDTNVDTGISVDSIPYLAMLGVVAVGGAGVVVSKKRRSED